MDGMRNDVNEPISYFAHEEIVARMERANRRWWILAIILIAAIIVTNGAWIIYESQFEDVVTQTYTAETDGGGTAIANGEGTVTIDGESDLYENKNKNP